MKACAFPEGRGRAFLCTKEEKMSKTNIRNLTVTALCIALCAVLPMGFHALNLGPTFSPMHIPPLICGLVCGPVYGAVCGLLGPIISSLTTSMPPVARLWFMVPELVAYGLLSGLFFKLIKTGNLYADIYCALVPAMVLGRIVGGIAQAITMMATAKEYSIAMWATGYFANAMPGIILHLILVPAVYIALDKAKLVPKRYEK